MTALRFAFFCGLMGFAALPWQPALAQSQVGAYLAGRHAIQNNDYATASEYFARALLRAPGNRALMSQTVLSQVAAGHLDRAIPVARRMEEMGLRNPAAHMVVVAALAEQGAFDRLAARDPDRLGVGPLVDGLVAGWAYLGAGETALGLQAFDAVAQRRGLRAFALYHKALALASVGEFDAAEAIFAASAGDGILLTRRGTVARAEILSQLGRNEEALRMLSEVFGNAGDPALAQVRARLAAGEVLPFAHATSARDGLAEVFFSVAAALNSDAEDQYTLLYSRTAAFLRPDHVDAALLTAQILDRIGQYDLAIEAYKGVPATAPDFFAAEQGRAAALASAGKPDTAIEVLEQLSVDFPESASVQTSLADLKRQQEDFAGAVEAYGRALAGVDDANPSKWFLYYARGISHERLGQWPQAEADFRAALALRPDQPQVLNYLGYSMVEMRINLDEALEMIERAVAAEPESGYIVDSLGWVLYRLGRYDEAVGHMERAVELMPVDPVVNDHLGDVYWAVGRHREAEFQWTRALSFIDPDETQSEADPDRIRRKLEIGLDAVLEEEGAPPLNVANDDT